MLKIKSRSHAWDSRKSLDEKDQTTTDLPRKAKYFQLSLQNIYIHQLHLKFDILRKIRERVEVQFPVNSNLATEITFRAPLWSHSQEQYEIKLT